MLSIYSNHVLHYNAGYESIKSGICIHVYTMYIQYTCITLQIYNTGYESIKSGTSFPLNIFVIELYITIYVLVYFISFDGLLLFDKANNISDRSI